MSRLNKLGNLVKTILEAEPVTRDSDDILYYRVCEELNRDVLNMSFAYVMANRSKLNLPPYKSVDRVRRKMQELHPELISSAPVAEYKTDLETEYREYSKIRS